MRDSVQRIGGLPNESRALPSGSESVGQKSLKLEQRADLGRDWCWGENKKKFTGRGIFLSFFGFVQMNSKETLFFPERSWYSPVRE